MPYSTILITIIIAWDRMKVRRKYRCDNHSNLKLWIHQASLMILNRMYTEEGKNYENTIKNVWRESKPLHCSFEGVLYLL